MSRRPHPIDDTFRQKLEHHVSPTPEHLWDGIAMQRSLRRKLYFHKRERILLVAVLLLFAYASALTWHLREMQPTLGAFPVALGFATPTDDASKIFSNHSISSAELPANTEAAATAKVSGRTEKVVKLLPVKPVEVECLSEQLVENIENIADQKPFTPSATALSAFQLSALPLTMAQVRRKAYLNFDPSKCVTFSSKPVRFYFDILASPDFTFRTIQPKTGDYEKYAQSRLETESARYNYSVGARLSAVSNAGLALRIGLNYSEINERFELQNENDTRIIITYDQNGNIIKTDTITQRIIHNNSYQTLDIPLLVGYEIPIKKVTLAINGGAYFNVRFKPKGEFLSPYDNRPITISNEENPESNPPAFRDNLGIGWYGSLGVSYKISPRLQLLVEPHLRMYPHSFTRDDFMTEQKYLTAGVFVGIRHQFSL